MPDIEDAMLILLFLGILYSMLLGALVLWAISADSQKKRVMRGWLVVLAGLLGIYMMDHSFYSVVTALLICAVILCPSTIAVLSGKQ